MQGAVQAGDEAVAARLGCDVSGTKRAICTQLEQRLLRDGAAAQPPSVWSLRVAASEVTGAGEGVHLRGSCEAGTVLACYPGVIFLPDDLPVMHQLVLTGTNLGAPPPVTSHPVCKPPS